MSATLATDDPALAAFADVVGDSGPVAVAGGHTRWDAGGELAAGTRIVDAPTGIVSYRPEEMTVTVRAGTPVAELHAELARRGQRTALPDRGGTVGGALAVGENDIRALGRGLVRTAPLQIRYVSAEGRLVTGGGPTVKNVTGFDLPRLLTGSLGTLGLMAEVILRTNPVPPVTRWVTASDVDPRAVLDAVLAPGAVLWDGETIWVELEGHGPDVDAEVGRLGAVGSFDEADGPPPLPPHRWSVSPAEALDAVTLGAGPYVAALGLGLVFAWSDQPARPLPPAVATVTARLKANFDPTGRLNPGRDPARR
ncbi:MAG: FAD-binding protein [Acidimicrobiales bacterium]